MQARREHVGISGVNRQGGRELSAPEPTPRLHDLLRLTPCSVEKPPPVCVSHLVMWKKLLLMPQPAWGAAEERRQRSGAPPSLSAARFPGRLARHAGTAQAARTRKLTFCKDSYKCLTTLLLPSAFVTYSFTCALLNDRGSALLPYLSRSSCSSDSPAPLPDVEADIVSLRLRPRLRAG